jgi:hypothetical protein
LVVVLAIIPVIPMQSVELLQDSALKGVTAPPPPSVPGPFEAVQSTPPSVE